MTPLRRQIKSLDLPEIVRAAGVELAYRGGRYVGLCPLHDDTSPSFVIYKDQHWWCHAENIGGDAVDLTQRLHNCDFKTTCAMLGIQIGKPERQTISEIKQAKKKTEARRAYQQRERELTYTLATEIRRTKKAMTALTPENFENYGDILAELAWMEYCHDLLIFGEPAQRRELVKSLAGMKVIKRNQLFKDNFGYMDWLRTQTQTEAGYGKIKRNRRQTDRPTTKPGSCRSNARRKIRHPDGNHQPCDGLF